MRVSKATLGAACGLVATIATAQWSASPRLIVESDTTRVDTEAIRRLTEVVASAPACAESQIFGIQMTGRFEANPLASFTLNLALTPGASIAVDDRVVNSQLSFEGSFESRSQERRTYWVMSPASAGVLRPKSYFRAGELGLALPARFSADGREVYATLGLKCRLVGSDWSCYEARFAFGDQLALALNRGSSWLELLPPSPSPPPDAGLGESAPPGEPPEVLSCCVGEYRCDCVSKCTGSGGGSPCPFRTCINCWPNACWDCRDYFGSGNCLPL